ncbi:GrxA family glutaredoxin, partial [Pantoea sp. CTOTU50773]|uniref:GrxA family glutaredoxin n=1 Tax=Pantoea sp. CTOTU50773 TaxID=2953853 RepID=UPI0028AAD382
MIAVIFGRSSCPYCVRAKELATKLTSERDDFNYQYVDIQATGITKADLEARAGKPVTTVPQIFHDDLQLVGYNEFAAWSKENL